MDDLDLGATIKGFIPGQKVFSRYTLKKILGRGGMGVVWLARDDKLERDVALKFLPETVAADERALDDLKRETRRSLELTHPHIVRIHDFVDDARTAAIAMEYVDGRTLSKLALETPDRSFPVAELRPWVEQLCAALDYAHGQARVVHRDLKPANLMVDAAGRLKIADFGISATLSDSTTRVSKTAGTSGTPVYMSPQQMMGEKPAVTDDIYSLGATLYDLLTGKPPFYSGNILLQVQNKVPPPVNERRAELGVTGEPIPPEWEATIAACLAKEPQDRPQSAGEVLKRLGLTTKGTKSTKPEPKAGPDLRAGREQVKAVGASLADARQGERARSSRAPTMLAFAAGVIGLAAAGWWFGVHAPEQRRIEAERLAVRQAVAEQERAAAEVERQRLAAEQARLANARGGLIVRTEPAGAEVAVGGVGIEKSPATFRELRLGDYEVTVSKAGHEPQTLRLTVEENRFTQPPVITLAPTVGGVELTSEPAGLDYELRSTRLVSADVPAVRRTGRTPATLGDLPIGDYQLTQRREGWPDKGGAVKVERGATARWTADFVGGALTLETEPAGLDYEVTPAAGVTAGAKYARLTGRTPATLSDLPIGNYAVTYRRAGWPEQVREVSVSRGGTARAAAEFVPGSLELTSTPSGAEVWSGGRQVGTTPYRVPEALPGRYEYELRLARHKPVTVGVMVNPRQTTRESVRLEAQPFPVAGQPFENSLGMKFVPVPGTSVLFSIWETREQDYGAFARATGRAWSNANAGATHPAVNVSWEDAQAFCQWLTQEDRRAGRLGPDQSYRLPTDAEWSLAVGLPNEPGSTPADKDEKVKNHYPWGTQWPPPRGAGNYADETAKRRNPGWTIIQGYDDGHAGTAPVGSFAANTHGLHDLGGNVWEWVEDRWNSGSNFRVLRGASFYIYDPVILLSSYRGSNTPDNRYVFLGFRVVVAVGSSAR